MNEKLTKAILYGDGVNDDYPYIQGLLDSGVAEVYLPAPKVNYTISKTLKISGGQTLRLAKTTVIKLAPDSNCAMIENKDFTKWSAHICIDGGIWDMNHAFQEPNPFHFAGKDGKTSYQRIKETGWDFKTATVPMDVYTGFCMRFCRVKYFTAKNVTILNPVVYGIQIAYADYFTFRDITFDYTEGSPKLWNMDGVHVEGHCRNGYLCNLQGACHDDLVAITADDGLYGPIENVVVDGIFAYGSHSAVRLLSHGLPVKNVTIKNVYGSYYVYCIGITKYHGDETERGIIENVTIENVCASACQGTKDVSGGRYNFIWIEKGLDVENLKIQGVYRDEREYPTPTIKVDQGATVKGLAVKDVIVKNRTGKQMQALVIDGEVTDFSQEKIVIENL